MINTKTFVEKIGMDKAIAYSSGSRIVAGAAGVLSVFFISTFLTGVEQGFYFTFGSILAMQVFFELGLTGIMTQYVAHEVSHLTLNNMLIYEGEQKYQSRLASLIHFCIKWYLLISVLVFIFLLLVGYFYFNEYSSGDEDVSWQLPWIVICLATALKLFQSPFNSIFMGLGMVKEMSKIVFFQQLIIPLSTWAGLILGLKLYVVGISYLLSVVVWQIYVCKSHLYRILLNLLKVEISEKVLYLKEIFPYQWKIAISWVSGYFVYHLFNPVLFATEGAVVAGQMGMTIHALSSIQAIAISWQNTKVPLYSRLIALKNYVELDRVFLKTLKQMVSVCSVLFVSFLFIIYFLNYTQLMIGDTVLASRFLSISPIVLLAITIFINLYVTSWATYLRCHKQEPYLIYSVCSGLACCLSTIILGNLFGLHGIIIGFFIVTFIFFPWSYWIYKTKKELWHKMI